MTYVSIGSNLVLTLVLQAAVGTGVTGQTPTVALRRSSDNYYFDWNDSTFKVSGWTTRKYTMPEVSATLAPGVYEVKANLSTAVTAATVVVAEYENTGTTCPGVHQETYEFVIDNSTMIKRLLGLSQENFRITSPTYSSHNMTGATLKTYPTATDATNDTNPLATYTVTATYDGNGDMSTYKVVKNA